MATDYTPIACDPHDILELAITQGGKLRVRFEGEHDSHLITPLELSARNGEEFLRYRGTGGVHEIRLDKLKELHQDLKNQPDEPETPPAAHGGKVSPTKQ